MTFTVKGSYNYIFYILILVLFSSCASRYKNALFTSPWDNVTDTLNTVVVINDKGPSDFYYRIKPNDQLAIRNVQNLEFGTTEAAETSSIYQFLVDLDGSVNLPVVGRVHVAGLSRRDATNKIQELYSKQLLRNPIIELSVVNLKVTMLGAFENQGTYLLEREDDDLVSILSKAGGLSENADPKQIKIIRGDRKNPEIIYVNLTNIRSLSSEKLLMQNNDIVYAESTRRLNSKTFTSTIQPIVTIISAITVLYTLFSR